jgi:hypothetical protein
MMEYFREGGFSMWLLLVVALATGGYAFGRDAATRPRVLYRGAVVTLAMGLFGISTGMVAVSHGYERFPDKAAAVAQGLGELANNGTFATFLFVALSIAGLVAERRAKKA